MKKNLLMTYDEVIQKLPTTKHLLLGNGFSIGCDPIFQYQNLFDYVRKKGLSDSLIKVFRYLGTNNFEGVLRLLEDIEWGRKYYSLIYGKSSKSTIRTDLRTVKKHLVAAIAETHLAHSGLIADSKKEKCVQFLSPYKNVFTTNYDLLLYWISMHGHDRLQEQDGFRTSLDDPSAEYLVFRERVGGNNGIFFIHGALHTYVQGGEVRKHCWVRSDKPLIELVKAGLSKQEYPLFIAEGKAENKLEQIQRSGYLSYCFGKLERIEKALVIYGSSLNETDQHILHAIADNHKLENLYVGLHGKLEKKSNQNIIAVAETLKKRRNKLLQKIRTGRRLNIFYYDSSTAKVWN